MGEEKVMPYFVDNFGHWILFNERKFFGPIFCITAMIAVIWCRNKKMRYCLISYGVYSVVNVCIYYVVKMLALMYAIMPRSGFRWSPGVFEDAVQNVLFNGINIFVLKIIYDMISRSNIKNKKTLKVLISIIYALFWNVITLIEALLLIRIFYCISL